MDSGMHSPAIAILLAWRCAESCEIDESSLLSSTTIDWCSQCADSDFLCFPIEPPSFFAVKCGINLPRRPGTIRASVKLVNT